MKSKKNKKWYPVCNLLLFLYPYIYMFIIAGNLLIENGDIVEPGITAAIIIHLLIVLILVSDAIINKHQIVPTKDIVTINMIIKLVHIPAFIFHFVVGVFSSLLSVWGIGFVIAVVVIDLLTIIISGTYSVITIVTIYKQKKVSLKEAIICAICSYIYCVDIVVAIYLNVKVRAELKIEQIKMPD